MTRTITIDPVTRMEGHAIITLLLDDSGEVADARFHGTEFRGFEKVCEGRSFYEMPGITARICGLCPISHILASSKAGDAILGVRIPPAAEKLRRLLNWAHIVQSHALSFFLFSAPDLYLGMESDPASRNIFGLNEKHPEMVREGIALRKFGHEVIQILGGETAHPSWVVPGGVREPLTEEKKDRIAHRVEGTVAVAVRALDRFKATFKDHAEEMAFYGNFPSLFLGLVAPDGALEHYDGLLRVIDAQGALPKGMPEDNGSAQAGIKPEQYRDIIGEKTEDWSNLKFPFYKPLLPNLHAGMYRVGPLARMNLCRYAGTPRAERERGEFRELASSGEPVGSSFHYHYARLIEILYCLEEIGIMLEEPDLLDAHVRSKAEVNQQVGIGVCEAPRGTLFHEYHVDKNGTVEAVDLIIATGQNNLAMNETIKQIAGKYVHGDRLSEGMLNRVEAGIRAYDPCLSCATHAVGKMPMQIYLLAPNGTVLDQVDREA